MCSIQTMPMLAPAQFADRVDQFARLAIGQAAADLVEQQQRRPASPARAPVPAACGRAGRASRRGGWRRPACRTASANRALPHRPRRGRGRRHATAATKTFSKVVMPLNGFGTWCVRTRPSRQRSCCRQRRHVVALEADRAGAWRKGAGEHAEQRRLAGAVRADNADRLVGAHGEVDVVEHHKRAEALVDAGGGENRLLLRMRSRSDPRQRSISRCKAGAWRRPARSGRWRSRSRHSRAGICCLPWRPTHCVPMIGPGETLAHRAAGEIDLADHGRRS